MNRLDRLRAAVDRELGEAILVVPQTEGRMSSGKDPNRAPFEAVAVVVAEAGGDFSVLANRRGGGLRLPVQGVAIHIDPVRYPAATKVVTGDRVEVPGRSATFEISRVDRLGRTRLTWSVDPR